MNSKEELEIVKGFLSAAHGIAAGLKAIAESLHDVADAMRQGPEDEPAPRAPQYLDQGVEPPKDPHAF